MSAESNLLVEAASLSDLAVCICAARHGFPVVLG